MGALDYLADSAHPDVIEGLTNDCGICKRGRGLWCVHVSTGEPLGRLHLERTQQALDKRPRRKKAR